MTTRRPKAAMTMNKNSSNQRKENPEAVLERFQALLELDALISGIALPKQCKVHFGAPVEKPQSSLEGDRHMNNDNVTGTSSSQLFDTYISKILPSSADATTAKDVSRRLMEDIKAQDSIEEILGSLIVLTYSQIVYLIGKSNEGPSFFKIPYESATPEAMGYLRIISQLSSNLLKFRRERARQFHLEQKKAGNAPDESQSVILPRPS